MGDKTGISWTDATWNCVRGCSMVSPGCANCYAMRLAGSPRMAASYGGLTKPTRSGPVWTGEVRFVEDMLDRPLRWKKPRRIFVNSMSDVFHESLSNEQIAAIFGVMAAAPQHAFQVLTKRAKRMREWCSASGTAARVDLFRHVALAGRIGEVFADERVASVAGWPGYFVSSKGRVFSERRGAREEMAIQRNDAGHGRVQLYRGAKDDSERLLVHRLVLTAFDRPGREDEQGCHIDGDPVNCALWNLRWGSQSENWNDSKRHGTRRRYSKLTEEQAVDVRRLSAAGVSGAEIGRRFAISDTQARNIASGRQWSEPYAPAWPLPSVWLGVSVEDQARADERIPLLLETPAAVRFVSAEPLLGPLDLDRPGYLWSGRNDNDVEVDALDWVIVGGESGPGFRPMDLAWARSLRDQCAGAGVAFYFKQASGYRSGTGEDALGAVYHAYPINARRDS